MQIKQIKKIKMLVHRLKQDPVFRYCCCFPVCEKIPLEPTFSRFISKISESEDLKQLFRKLVTRAKELNIVDGETIAIDATKIDSPKGVNDSTGSELFKTIALIAEFMFSCKLGYFYVRPALALACR